MARRAESTCARFHPRHWRHAAPACPHSNEIATYEPMKSDAFNPRLPNAFVLMPLLFLTTAAISGPMRHQCDLSEFNVSSFLSLRVDVPDNCAASGSPQTYTSSFVVGGCRGC